jgi:hypothetical protein
VFDCLRSAPARIARVTRRLRRRSPTEKRVGSLLLSTAARDPGFILSRKVHALATILASSPALG